MLFHHIFFKTFASPSSDIEKYARKKFYSSVIPQSSGLWENISLCSDVLEGAWYQLYDNHKEPKRSETVKKFIRESIDSFHSTLVTESKICISLAVFGPLGAGKSFFVNYLLNWGLRNEHRLENGPLPSAFGGTQTPVPIYVKFGKNVLVSVCKQKDGVSTDYETLFSEPELGEDTLALINSLLKEKFQEGEGFRDAKFVEVQGPFPVFRHLKKRAMTSSGHLELEVDVEFVDLPGCGDATGNESIKVELSKTDVVLFFDWGKSGRPVSSEDIAQVFRRHEEFEFTSRPKLVHVFNDRSQGSHASSCNFDRLCEKKKEELGEAWSSFLSSSLEDKEVPGCYEDVKEKLPQLNGEALLEKLAEESEVIYFHSENSGILNSLKKVIDDHVQCVKIKQTIHPFLQNVHLAAKKLKTRIGSSISTEKKRGKAPEVKDVKEDFDIRPNINEATDVVTSYLAQAKFPFQQDIEEMQHVLYDDFVRYGGTLPFLKNMLQESLEIFKNRLIYAFINANCPTSQDVSTDLIDVVEILCQSRVQEFCAYSAPAYLRSVLDEGRSRKLSASEKKKWSRANAEAKKGLCEEFLVKVLITFFAKKETRSTRQKNPHFQLVNQLREDVKDLLAVRSFDDDNASRTAILELLFKRLKCVIEFCNKSIREINPHPCLDVKDDISIPQKMKPANEDNKIQFQSSHDKIIKSVEQLLLKPSSKGANAIRELEKKLNFGKNGLELRHSQSVDQHLWAKVLLNVLCDKDHFDLQLDPTLVLDRQDEEINRLLSLARKRLFAHQKSSAFCKIVNLQSVPGNEIRLMKSVDEENCIEVKISSRMSEKLDAIRESQQLAPIFIPTIRPGPTPDNQGNYFLEEDPWSRGVLLDERLEEEGYRIDEEKKDEGSTESKLELNIFLVVEPQDLKTCQTTIAALGDLRASIVNLNYIVLPQRGRGIGVTRAIIKILAECFKFDLYWTVDDDIRFMYQFDENDRRWHKCSLTRGLLFGQRVFQTCLEKTVRELSREERDDLFDDVTSPSRWPKFPCRNLKRAVRSLLINDTLFEEVQKNPALLHSPFAQLSEDCGGDPDKEKQLKDYEEYFVEECRKRLFEDTVYHIAGVSLAHESTKKYDYMSKYPKADYMCSEQRYQVVLNNTCALKGRNFVTDEMIFCNEEFQVRDKDKRNTPYYGIRGSDKSFCRALTVSGVIGYQVIRIVHSHKKLTNVFDRVGPSYLASQSPYRSEDEDVDVEDCSYTNET